MPVRFTLRQLEYFVAVGEAGTIAMAAEIVNVSSPSISAAISQLEEEFGLPLFVRRHAQGLSPTQAGRQMLQQAREVLRAADALARAANDISGRVQGPIAVGCLSTFAQLVVPRVRRQFETAHPGVRISQSQLHQQDIFDRLRSGQIDVALTYDLEIPPDLRFLPLVTLRPYALFPQDHPLAGQQEVSISALCEHPMVLLDLPLSNEYFLSLFRDQGLKPKIVERTRDIAVMRSLVGNGFGYSIANIRPVADLAPDGSPVRTVPISGPVRPMVMGIVATEGAENVLTVRAFIDHCRAEIGDAAASSKT